MFTWRLYATIRALAMTTRSNFLFFISLPPNATLLTSITNYYRRKSIALSKYYEHTFLRKVYVQKYCLHIYFIFYICVHIGIKDKTSFARQTQVLPLTLRRGRQQKVALPAHTASCSTLAINHLSLLRHNESSSSVALLMPYYPSYICLFPL